MTTEGGTNGATTCLLYVFLWIRSTYDYI